MKRKIKLHYRLLALIMTVLAVMMGIFVYNWDQKKRHVAELEQIKITEFARSLEQIIALKTSKQRLFAYDYTYWDEMVAFTARPDPQWAYINLTKTRTTFDADFIYIIGRKGELLFHLPHNGHADVCTTIQNTKFDMNRPVFESYFIASNNLPVQIFTAPIQHSDDTERKGTPYGYMAVAKVWTQEWVTQLQQITGQKLDLIRLDDDTKEVYDWIYPLHNKEGKAIFALGVTFNKSSSTLLDSFFQTSMMSFFLMGLLGMVVVAWFVYRKIVLPLDNVSEAVRRNSSEPIRPLMNGNDEFASIARLMNERFEHQDLMIRQSRLAAMGEMIGNIAHQWRQPLNTLSLIVQDTEEAYAAGEMDETYIQTMSAKAMEQINFMSATIDDFRNFFKPNQEKIIFDPSVHINKALHLIDPTLKRHRISTSVSVPAGLRIFGYPNEFLQVVLNIVKNAMDAFTSHAIAHPRIHISGEEIGDKTVLRISDNAGGIDQAIAERIFEPYFTTKNEAQGTGIGLYMSKMIIEEHMEGAIDVQNNEEGAVFTISLPSGIKNPDNQGDFQ